MAFETTNFSDKPVGYAQAAAGTVDAAVAVTTFFPGAVPPAGTARLTIKPFAQAVRFRDDGTAPTTTVGYPVAVGAEFVYTGRNMAGLLVIAQVAGAGLDILAAGT